MDHGLIGLKPCPFCDSGETDIHENYMPPTMSGKKILISVTVSHWCVKSPGVVASHIEFRGRDRESAIAAWNKRTISALEST